MIFLHKYNCFLEAVRRYVISDFRFYFCRSLSSMDEFESLEYLLMPYETPILSYTEDNDGTRKKPGRVNFVPARARTFTAAGLNQLTGKIDCVFLARGDRKPELPDLSESMISLSDARTQYLTVGQYTLRDLDIAAEASSGPGFVQKKTKGFFFDQGLMYAITSYAAAAFDQGQTEEAKMFLAAVRKIPHTWNEYQICQEMDHLKNFCGSRAEGISFSYTPEKTVFSRMAGFSQPVKPLSDLINDLNVSRKKRREILAPFFEENPQEAMLEHPYTAGLVESGKLRRPYFADSLRRAKNLFMRDEEEAAKESQIDPAAVLPAVLAPAPEIVSDDGDEEISVFSMG